MYTHKHAYKHTCTHIHTYTHTHNSGLLQRKNRYRKYIKPWMKRKRLKEVKKYRSMERGVLNLKKYVHFVNDYKQKHLWKKGE